ncbi:unnamed protein product, partial [Mesorhabditis belari]|uniref:Enoyl reductase (ER) domain-containing protein n=1 Tax=Mesorhabditis belari TaxID=2138241 RepID=A0AAF3JB68_9BILA
MSSSRSFLQAFRPFCNNLSLRGYKAAVVTEIGKPLEVRDLPSKEPGPNELVVEVESCGFNYGDWKMIKGMYHLKPKRPFVPGFELAGNVKKVGEKVQKWKAGDRVLVLRRHGTGGFAEECIVKEHDLIYNLPFSINYETAAAVAVTYGTAYVSLANMARERQGSSVLVLSARGTMGFAAIDLAQNVFAAQRTINWEKEDLVKVIRKDTFNEGVDVVVDTVGGKVFHTALESLKKGGHLVSLSFASGEIPSVSLLDLHRLQATVTGVWLGGRTASEIDAIMSTIIGLFDEGYLSARIEAKYGLDQMLRRLCTKTICTRRLWEPGTSSLEFYVLTAKPNQLQVRCHSRFVISMEKALNHLENIVYARQARNGDRLKNAQRLRSQKRDEQNEKTTSESEESSDNKDKEENEQEKKAEEMARKISRLFAVALFCAGILYMINSSGDIGNSVDEISWTTFTEQMLPTKAIREIVLRAAEAALNMPPEYWIPVKYKRLDEISSTLNLIFLGLLFATGYYIFKKAKFSINMTDMMGQMTKQKLNIIDPHSPDGKKALKIKFKDVAGCHEAKVEIKEFVDYLKNSSKYTHELWPLSTVPFISMNGTEFVEMIGGLGASRIRGLFKEAKQRAPCIIYIDEIDAIGRKRSEAGGKNGFAGSSEEEQTLNQLLVEMDGMDSAKGVVVLASTNRPDVLDKALLRRGRFDRHVSIDLPTVAERKEMFELYLKKIKTDFASTKYSERLAQMTPGFSGADIRNAVNEAAIKAATDNLLQVSVKEMEYAMDKIIAGPAKRSRTLVKEERATVAYHEAGHALVGWMLEHTDALLKVTIIPRTSAALGFAQYCPRDKKLFTKEELFERMCMMLGGRAAENLKFGRITTGAQNDLEKVTKSAMAQVKNYGFSPIIGPLSFAVQDERAASFYEKPYSQKLQATIDQEASLLVGQAYRATEELIQKNIDKLELIAQSLLKHEVLSYEDVKKLIGPPPFGEKQVVDLVENSLPKDGE